MGAEFPRGAVVAAALAVLAGGLAACSSPSAGPVVSASGPRTVVTAPGAGHRSDTPRPVVSRTPSTRPTSPTPAPRPTATKPVSHPPEDASEAAGYRFLYLMLDQHGSGGTLRLPQSYTGGFLERDGFTDSVTYDDALVVEALLARGTAEDVSRAATLGRSLLYVQANDPRHDGRMRAAYAPSALTGPGRVVATDPTSDVGNMAWVGLALLRLYQRTGDTGFRDGAVRIGDWIQANARDTRGHGGYIGGFDTDGSRLTWKSTEHNLDVYAFFTSLAASTGDAAWRDRAGWARTFAVTMYDTSAHRFQTGTDEDGVHVNRDLLPSDTQTWSYLALHDAAYAGSLDYAATALSATDGPFSGVSFSLADRSRVWFEGTAHLADALLLRGGPGDVARADAYLATIRLAQRSAPNNDGMGIVAASRDGLKTGDGSDKYYASLHTGATAWYLLALRDADPFR